VTALPNNSMQRTSLMLGVLLTPKSGLYSLKVGMSAIGTKPHFEAVILYLRFKRFRNCYENRTLISVVSSL
jgi:hypothetical protein